MKKELVEVLKELDPTDGTKWNADGSPKLFYIRTATGDNTVTQEDILQAWAGYGRDMLLTLSEGVTVETEERINIPEPTAESEGEPETDTTVEETESSTPEISVLSATVRTFAVVKADIVVMLQDYFSETIDGDDEASLNTALSQIRSIVVLLENEERKVNERLLAIKKSYKQPTMHDILQAAKAARAKSNPLPYQEVVVKVPVHKIDKRKF